MQDSISDNVFHFNQSGVKSFNIIFQFWYEYDILSNYKRWIIKASVIISYIFFKIYILYENLLWEEFTL